MSQLTRENLDANDDVGRDRLKETNDFDRNFRDQTRERALKIYKNELNRPSSIDLGLHGVTRAALRTLCKTAVLESSKSIRRRYSYSALSSSINSLMNNNDNNAISALRMLQKERLIVSRLGFPDKAMELDKEIEVMREKAKKARAEEESKILYQRMKTLAITHHRKEQRLEFILGEETRQMNERFAVEERKLLKRQEIEFLRVLENATRRAIGRVKKCNCDKPYTCRHNKTASYNTRRPTHTVVQYRRNAKRLKRAGRPEEAAAWEEKSKELDEKEQEMWRARVADSIVSSPWGANEAAVDQITELHKRELAVLRKTHAVKQDMHEKKQAMRRKNFRNTILAEERKVRMQCRKQALLRVRKDYDKEQREQVRQQKLQGHSDGLQNISRNLLGEQFDDDEKKQVDWVPPTNFGLDNSVRLIDAVKELNPSVVSNIDSEAVSGRILTSKKDMAQLTPDQLRAKIHSGLRKDDNSDVDSDSDEDGAMARGGDGGEEDIVYKLGVTSGSKLVDRMRQNRSTVAKKDDAAVPATPTSPSLASSTTALGGWPGANNGSTFGGFPAPNTGMFPTLGVAAGATSPGPTTPSTMGFNGGTPLALGGGAAGFWGSAGSLGNNPFGSWNANPFVSNTAFPTATPATGAPAAGPSAPAAAVVPAAPSTPAPSAPSFRSGLHLASAAEGGQPQNASQTPPKPAAPVPSMPFPAMQAAATDATTSNMQQHFQHQMNQAAHHGGLPNQGQGQELHSHDSQTSPAKADAADDVDGDDAMSGYVDDRESDDGARESQYSSNNNAAPKSAAAGRQRYVFDPVEDTKPVSFKPGSVRDNDWKEHDTALANSNGVENSYGVSAVDKREAQALAMATAAEASNVSGSLASQSHASKQAQGSSKTAPAPAASSNAAPAATEPPAQAQQAPVAAPASFLATPAFPANPFSQQQQPSMQPQQPAFTSQPGSQMGMGSSGMPPWGSSMPQANPFGSSTAMTSGSPWGNSTGNPFASTPQAVPPTSSSFPSNAGFGNAPMQFAPTVSASAMPASALGGFPSSSSLQSAPPSMQAPAAMPSQPLGGSGANVNSFASHAAPTMVSTVVAAAAATSTPMSLELPQNAAKQGLSLVMPGSPRPADQPSATNGQFQGLSLVSPGSPRPMDQPSQANGQFQGLSLAIPGSPRPMSEGINPFGSSQQSLSRGGSQSFGIHHDPPVPGTPDAVPSKSALAQQSHYNKKGQCTTKSVAKKSVQFGVDEIVMFETPAASDDGDGASSTAPASPASPLSSTSSMSSPAPPLMRSTSARLTEEILVTSEGSSETLRVVPSDMDVHEKERLVEKFTSHHPNHVSPVIEEIKEDLRTHSYSSDLHVALAAPAVMPVPHVPSAPKPESGGFQRPAAKLYLASQAQQSQQDGTSLTTSASLEAHEMRQIEALAARASSGGTTRGSMDMSVLSMGSVGGVSASNAYAGGNVSTRSSMDLTMQLTDDPVFHDHDEAAPESQPQAQTTVPSFTSATAAASSAPSQPQATTISSSESHSGPSASAASMAPWSAPNSFGMTAAPTAQAVPSNPFGSANDVSSQQQPSSFGGSGFGGFNNSGFPSSGSFPANSGFPSSSFGQSGPETSFASSPTNANPFASFPSASPAPMSQVPASANNAASSFGSFPSGTNTFHPAANATMGNNPYGGQANNNHVDLSHDYTHETQSASTDDAMYVQKGGPNWDLALFRLANLDNIHETLEFILTDVDLYEAAELYISTIGSHHHDHVGPDSRDRGDGLSPRDGDEDDGDEHDAELHSHELTMHLQLLRGWKRYQQHPEDTEGLLMGLEEVLGLEQEDIMDHLSDAVRHNEAKLQQIFNDMAYALVPEFILSSDFEAYFETHSPVKAHNKKLRIDSKSWLGKFQKVANDHSVPCHLFLGSGGTDHRPYANNKMRAIFGPMCDAPSPREYIDPGHNDPAAVQAFLQAMKEGQDVMTALICRTMKNGRPPALLAVKHMHSYKHPEMIKYSLVVYHDMSQPDGERKLKVVQALLKSMP